MNDLLTTKERNYLIKRANSITQLMNQLLIIGGNKQEKNAHFIYGINCYIDEFNVIISILNKTRGVA